MKNLLLSLCCVVSITASAQVETKSYSIFNRANLKKDFFITTNSGVFNTPVGLKIGFVSDPGLYLGLRHGIGKVYHSDSDFTTSMTNLFSITGGINFPLYIKNSFRILHKWEAAMDNGGIIDRNVGPGQGMNWKQV